MQYAIQKTSGETEQGLQEMQSPAPSRVLAQEAVLVGRAPQPLVSAEAKDDAEKGHRPQAKQDEEDIAI